MRQELWVEELGSVEECSFEAERLLIAIADVKSQLDAAKTKAVTEGEYSDPVWFRKANSALRYFQADLQRVQNRRGFLRRSYSLKMMESRDRALLTLIKEMFPEQFKAAAERLPALEKANG
jgi:hypothetical protein